MPDFRYLIARQVLSGENRIRFYEVLKMQLESGKNLEEAMRNIYAVYTRNGARFHPYGEFAMNCIDALSSNREGNQIQDVFARWFSEEEATTLAVGLRSSSLVKSLDSLMSLIRALRSIRGRAIGAALAPLGAVLLLSGIFSMIALQVVPPLIQLIPPERASGALSLVYGIAEFTVSQGIYWLIGFVIVFILSIVSLKTWTGPGRNLADNLPPWSLYKLVLGSVFLMNLATLLDSGMSFGAGLKSLHDGGSPWLKSRLRNAVRHFDNGDNLGVALDKSGFTFPSAEIIMHLRMLSDGDHAAESIRLLADWWLVRTNNIAKGMLYLSMVSAMLLVFGCLSLLALSMMSLRQMMGV